MKILKTSNPKKLISFFISLITFSFILNFSLISDSHSNDVDEPYVLCATAPAGTVYSGSGADAGKSAEGAILVQDLGAGDITSFALASSPTNFNVGGTDQSCDITPDKYKLVFYRLGLCTDDPYRAPNDTHTNTIKADLSSCTTYLNNTSGKEVIITPDGEVNLFDEPIFIPIGTYPYSYLIADNHVSLEHTQKFINAADNSPALIKGYHASSYDKELDRGTVCYTAKDASGNPFVDTYSWEIDSSGVSGGMSSLHGHDLPDNYPGTPPHTRYRCGTISEAAAGIEYAITIVNTIGDRLVQTSRDSDGNTVIDSFDTTKFRNASGCCRTNTNISGQPEQFYNLLKTDNESLATDIVTARRILLVQINDGNPTVMSENTIGFKIRFKTDNAINVRIYQEEDADGENRDEILHGTKMQANEIWLDFQTKTRRSRGAWR